MRKRNCVGPFPSESGWTDILSAGLPQHFSQENSTLTGKAYKTQQRSNGEIKYIKHTNVQMTQ